MREIVKKKLGIKNDAISVNNSSRVERLISSYEASERDLMIEIKMKMTEFNSVYNDLNQ